MLGQLLSAHFMNKTGPSPESAGAFYTWMQAPMHNPFGMWRAQSATTRLDHRQLGNQLTQHLLMAHSNFAVA